MSQSDRDLPSLPPPLLGQISTGSLSSRDYTSVSRSTSDSRTHSRKRSTRTSKDSFYEETRVELLLQKLTEQLQAERTRADEAERQVLEVTEHLKAINDARLEAVQEAAKANEELRLYKIQLDVAQKEIFRAQDVVEVIDRQRYNAEKDAAKHRTRARQLNEQILIQQAREEAWRLGLQEGLDRGRDLKVEPAPFPVEEDPETKSFYEDDYSIHESVTSASEPARPIQMERPRSFAPSIASSKRPASEAVGPLPVPPMPTSRPPSIKPASIFQPEPVHPVRISNVPRSPRPPSAPIPPDNLIPSLDENNKIRLPPPFEFHRQFSTPEPPPSPPLHALSDSSQEPLPIPPKHHHRGKGHRRQSSSGSNSSTLSHLDLGNDPHGHGMRTPMSIIPEVNSNYSGSPHPKSFDNEGVLRHQRSVSDTGHHDQRRPPSFKAPSVNDHQRPFSGYTDNSYYNPPANHSRPHSHTSGSTAPGITVEPPSRDHSNKTDSVSLWGPSSPGRSFQANLQPVNEDQDATGFQDVMPGNYNHPPVPPQPSSSKPMMIPNGSFRPPLNNDDAVSSRLSLDTLTTPVNESGWAGTQRSSGRY